MNFIIGLLLLVSAAQANADVIGTYGIFSLYRNDDNCRLIASYEDDNIVSIDYYAKEKNSHVGFTNKKAKSLNEADERVLNVAFLDGDNLDDGWKNVRFTTTLLDDGSRALTSRSLNSQILDDFAEGRIIAFFYKEKLVGSYRLTGSKKAVDALRSCALGVAGLDPDDPFAEQ